MQTAQTKESTREPKERLLKFPVEWLLIGVPLIATIILITAYGRFSPLVNFYLHENLNFREAAAWGQLGDFMGGILNPLISACTLVVAVMVWSLQKKELLKSQSALAAQERNAAQQQDKQTFFKLLRLRAEAVGSVEWPLDKQTVRGRAAIKAILKTLDKAAKEVSPSKLDIKKELTFWCIPEECPEAAKPYVAIFSALYSRNSISHSITWVIADAEDRKQLGHLEGEIGHVFRATYQVLKFIYESIVFSDKDKTDLVNYLRAQMSEAEFALFALTSVTSVGEKSRAISIAFDLYQNRLISIDWAQDMKCLFDPLVQKNAAFAETKGYPVLSKFNHAD